MADPNETGAAQETTEYDLWLKELQERKAALIEQLQSLGTEDVLRSGIAETQQELDAETEAKQGLEAQHTLLIGEQGALLQAKEKEEKAREQLETDSGNLAEQLVRIDGEDFELQLLDLDPELKEKKSAKEQAIQEREQAELDVAAVESSLEDNRQRQTWDEENRVRKDMAFHDYISKIQKEYVVLASMDELQKSNREVLEQLEKNRHIPAGTRDDLRRMAGRSGEDARTILEDLNTVIGERLSAERNAKQVSMETQDAKLGIEKPEEYFDRVKSFESSRDEVAALEEQRKMLHGLQGNPERLRELKAPLDQMIGEPERELLRLLDRYDNSFDVTDKKLTQLDSKDHQR